MWKIKISYLIISKMKKLLDTIWHDPVWSKVIGALIFWLITLIYNFIIAKKKAKKFKEVFIEFWTIKTDLWISILSLILLFILNYNYSSLGFWNYLIVFSIVLIYSYLFSTVCIKEPRLVVKPQTNILFNSELAKEFHFLASEEQNWEKDKPIGDRAKGKFSFLNNLLNIERENIDGRYLVRIEKYLNDGAASSFIKKDNNKTTRTISVKFQAKIIGGHHEVRIIAKKYNTTTWIHQANKIFELLDTNWRDFNVFFQIPPNVDFVINIDDMKVQRVPSSLQIRNLIISEET